ncbi:hypothetical protein K3495_g2913 [Podosphaera aphanis]|nr:hypothetical protein K3495_g2913 [Podosphaera aphanis]
MDTSRKSTLPFMTKTWWDPLDRPSLYPNLILTTTVASLIILVYLYTRLAARAHQTASSTPYPIPVLRHTLSLYATQRNLYMRKVCLRSREIRHAEWELISSRERSVDGIFTLQLGARSLLVAANLELAEQILNHDASALSPQTADWTLLQKCFGIPSRSREKYLANDKEIRRQYEYLIKEEHVSTLLKRVSRTLECNIAQMITFLDTEIDLQPWERWATTKYISTTESEVSLMPLMYMMMGFASIPAVFGSALLEKNPELIQNVFEMNKGMGFFLIGLPAWLPWSGVMKAHIARHGLWECLDEYQQALDNKADEIPNDPSWGNLDDIKKKFEIRERSDLSILLALIVNANLVAFWLILYIHSIPGLIERIRKEIAPYAIVSQGITIGKISEAPKLSLLPQNLSQDCPLLKACYFEALRLTDQAWSLRAADRDIQVPRNNFTNHASFNLTKGEYVAIPHGLHMQDPKCFENPEIFDPGRFLLKNGNLSAEISKIRPYGGGASMCKGQIFAERTCLSLVAGVIAFWDLESADKESGWRVPERQNSFAISIPAHDIRVRIKRRRFEWE